MEEKTNSRSGGSRSDELDDFGLENVEWLALHSGVPLEPLEVLTALLVEEEEDRTGRPPEPIPDVRALRTGLRRRSTDRPAEEEAKEPPAADPTPPQPRPSADPPPPVVDPPSPQPPLGDPPPPPTGEGLGGPPPGGDVPPRDDEDPGPASKPVDPAQAAIEAEWDASGIPIATKAKEYAGEEGIKPGETATGRGRPVNGVNQITKRDVRDAVGQRNRQKRKEEKEKAQDRALQQSPEASREAEPSRASGEAEEPEAAPRSDQEAGESGEGAEKPPTEAEEAEPGVLETSTLTDGEGDGLQKSAEELGATPSHDYLELFEENQGS